MTITTRMANQDDAASLAKLNSFVQDFHLECHPSYFIKARNQDVADYFSDLMKQECVEIWLAEADALPVGYVSAIIHVRDVNPFCRSRKWIEIDQIGVRAEFRKRGIAKKLLDRIKNMAAINGIDNIELASWNFNREAHGAFARLGFSPLWTRFGMTLDHGEGHVDPVPDKPMPGSADD